MSDRMIRTRVAIAMTVFILAVQATGILLAQQPAASGDLISKSSTSNVVLANQADRDVVSAPTESRRAPQSPDARGARAVVSLLLALLFSFALLLGAAVGRSSNASRATRPRAPPSFVF